MYSIFLLNKYHIHLIKILLPKLFLQKTILKEILINLFNFVLVFLKQNVNIYNFDITT